MKTFVFATLASLTSLYSTAQKLTEKEVPTSVKMTFQKSYPNAKEIKWEKEKDHYEASFDFNHSDYSVLYDANGNLLETEIEIDAAQLPKNIIEYISSHYKGQKIKEAAKITDAQGNLRYEAEIKNVDLIFDDKGNFLKEIKK